jgi:cellulose synthase/poly-beta-1,6-N-acetylglucosamine synthase-like glycosyltransferase
MQTTTYEGGNVAAMMFSGVFLVIILTVVVLILVSLWKIFEKAGQEGWKAIIPIYNMYILTIIIGKPWWWLLLMCIPYIGAIWGIWSTNLLSKSFGKTEGFTVGLVLLGFIFYPILAFDRTIVYKGPAGDPTRFNPINEDLNSIGKSL